jgi:phosphate transport system permease protein
VPTLSDNPIGSTQAPAAAPRRRTTRPAVRIAERVARIGISVGGIGTIVAVGGILVFLVWVVAPLFLGARVETIGPDRGAPLPGSTAASDLVHVEIDEGRLAGLALLRDGTLSLWEADGGATVERRKLFVADSITSCAFPPQSTDAALGFSDGKILVPRIGFQADVFDASKRPDIAAELGSKARGGVAGEVFERAPGNQIRLVKLDVELGEPIDAGLPGPIRLVDLSESGNRRFVCALTGAPSLAAGETRLVLLRLEKSENLLTGEVGWETKRSPIPYSDDARRGLPSWLLLSGGGDLLYLAWKDGHLLRYDLRDADAPALAEEIELTDGGCDLTSLAFLIGKTTLISGDARGALSAWFPTKPEGSRTSDGIVLARAHRLRESGPAITALAVSERSRIVAAGDADGGVGLWHVTSAKRLASMEPPTSAAEPVQALVLAPKEDGVFAFSAGGLRRFEIELGHPEATLASLFRPVWYEGYPEPEEVWQSTGGSDSEPKLGLVPLVFGTVKATVASMAFAVPLALLAAVFTSQFLSRRLRSPVKATVEMMASLPSVVLGFLAGIVIAPVAESVVPATLAACITVPFLLLFGARLWQLLPSRLAVRVAGIPRTIAIGLALVAGFLSAWLLGPVLERLLFAGNLLEWLDHRRGGGSGGWVLLLLPASVALVFFAFARTVDPWLRRASHAWERGRCARVDLLRFLAACAVSVAVAWGGAWVLDGLWLDPRGGVLDTYVQKNATIVGFVMGFAVVPIVYTLAEDALASVPEHLRLASLGAGATPWQTAVRIVLPTAASGIFSAIMVGLGRAVGETMIVLMATGNTPVMSWNIFNGFRTLSANIATELPEAVRGSTHYRTLFLAALCLFAMTFLLNTLAESVRQRFRKRAFQL